FNGVGGLTMQDVQGCYDALTDTNSRHLHLLPGTYLPGTVPGGNFGALTIDGDTGVKITCEPGAVMTTYNNSETDSDTSVIYVHNSTDVKIMGCELDGRVPATYTAPTNVFRMGMRIDTNNRVQITGHYIHHTMHAARYNTGSDHIAVNDTFISRVGGYGGTGNTAPCVYFYTDPNSQLLEDFSISNNRCEYAGQGIATRRSSAGERITNGVIAHNQIKRTLHAGMFIGGADNLLIDGNVMTQVDRGIFFDQTTIPAAYWANQAEVTKDVRSSNNRVMGVINNSTGGYMLGRYQTGLVFENNDAIGYGFAGVILEYPQRGLIIGGTNTMAISGNSSYGFIEQNIQSGASAGERATGSGFVIPDLDSAIGR